MRTIAAVVLVLALAVRSDALPPLRKPKHGFQVKVTPFPVAAGQDLEMCEYRRLPNKKAMDVSSFKLRMTEGAHHFVIWRYGGSLGDSAFEQGPQPSVGCAGAAPDEPVPQVLIPIQTPNARFQFPEGVALRLEPHEQVFLNSHLRNGEPTPIEADVSFNFYRARKGKVRHLAQGMIAGNAPDISIPAGGDQTLTAEWTAPVNLNVVELSTHQHRLGTYANIELVDTQGTPHKIYENSDWQHPPPYWPKQPIRLAKGDRMRITCTWHNTDDHLVRFGPKTTDEMCFILGFFYRDDGDTEPVRGPECIPSKSGLLCLFAPAVGG